MGEIEEVMSNEDDDGRKRLRRSIGAEFVRMEEDFDDTREKRKIITENLMSTLVNIKILDDDNKLNENSKDALALYTTTLKALNDTERSIGNAILLKLKNQEQEIASSAAAKDRIAIILSATAPGRIEESFPHEELSSKLTEMFGDDIKDFELKTNPRDLSD